MPVDTAHIRIGSFFGAMTQRGLVEIQIEDCKTQVSPAQARELAVELLEAAEAAISDGFLMHLLQDVVGFDHAHAARVLLDARRFRQAEYRAHPAELGADEPPPGDAFA